jgi:antitoxin YefM
MAKAKTVSVVSEETPRYGPPRRCGRQVVVTAEKMKRMRAPSPAEPERITELEAEANRRKRKRAAKSRDETAYLLRSPANAKRLLAAVKSLEAGKGKSRKLAE